MSQLRSRGNDEARERHGAGSPGGGKVSGSGMPRRCKVCGEDILSGKVVAASGAFFHPHHFKCTACARPLMEFMEKGGKPYCKEDFIRLFGEKCGCGCDQPLGEKRVKAKGKTFIPGHFVCAHCKRPLPGQFYENDGLAYCQMDYGKLFCDTCAVCNKAIIKGSFARNNHGQIMCATHVAEGKCECHDCGRYLPYGTGVELGLGSMCKACSGGAVVDDAQAAAILEQIRAALDPLGVSVSEGVRIHCKVADSAKLHRAAKKRQHTHVHQARLLGITRCKRLTLTDGKATSCATPIMSIINMLMPVKLNSSEKNETSRALLVLHDRGILAHASGYDSSNCSHNATWRSDALFRWPTFPTSGVHSTLILQSNHHQRMLMRLFDQFDTRWSRSDTS